MECDRAQELLPGYLDGSLDPAEHGEAEKHIRECSRCAAEERALNETLALLRGMQPEKAPPELLEGVRRRIAEEAPREPARRRSFGPARIRIPVEVAAAVVLVLLLYGIQRQLPQDARKAPSPQQGVESAATARGGAGRPADAPAPPTDRIAAATPRIDAGERTDGAGGPSDTGGKGAVAPSPSTEAPAVEEAGPAAFPGPSAETAPAARIPARADGAPPRLPRESIPAAVGPGLPVVPATRVSSGAEPVRPPSRESRDFPGAFPRTFAAPSTRPPAPAASAWEVTLEVPSGDRLGMEGRIARAAEALGGTVGRDEDPPAATAGAAAAGPEPRDYVRVHIPLESEEAFLGELRKMGTLAEGAFAIGPGRPAAANRAAVAYTVRIRLR